MKRTFLVSTELFRRLEDFCQENQIEFRNLLLAGFAILLHRIQELREVGIATPWTGSKSRPAAGWQRRHISFSTTLTVGQLLQDLQSPSVTAAGSSAEPCKTYFSFDSSEPVNTYPSDSLCLRIQPHNGTLEVGFIHMGGLFSERDLELLAGRYPLILEGMMRGTNQFCSEIRLLTDAETQHLLEWNENKVPYPGDTCLHTLIELQVERTPEAAAISYQGHHVTYRELNAQANQIAHFLIKNNIGPGSLVGLYTDPSPGMVSAMLGVLKTGAAYVCLDPVYPANTLKFIVEECELSFLITISRLGRVFPAPGKPMLFLDDQRLLHEQPTTNPALLLSSEARAFIVYTSGSTGRPKGVIHSHRNLVSRFHSTWAMAPTDDVEVYGQTSPLSSIDLIDELCPPLMRGHRIAMIDLTTVRDPNLLVKALEEARVTRLILVPSLLRNILSTDLDLARSLCALTVVLVGGEPLTYALADLFYQKLPQARLINYYGLTEGDGAYYPVPPGERISFAPPIGRPIANAKIHILDQNMQPAPIGMSGEIYIANEGMARGYFKRPDLDSQRFLSNPFSDLAEPRLYKTGDRGRFLPDGNIEYLGRIDRMVKIRGFRVELGEVEATINSHSEVRECFVMARQTHDAAPETLTRRDRLAAFVVLKTPQGISAQELKAYLQDRLPDYAQPGSIVLLESLPLSPAGKIDVSALPDPAQQPREPGEDFVGPRDPLEVQLTRIWERVLRISPIGIRDNFFDIGGDSLNAVDLFIQIYRDLQKDLPISAIMRAPTIEELADLIRQDTKSDSWSSLVPIQPSGTKLPLFCIHGDGGVMLYTKFVKYLGPDQPIFGLQARGLLGKTDQTHRNVREMAADYINEIQSVQPTGPYQLCGFSMGGVVAFEMACQLRAAGEEVAFIGLLDSYSPGYPKPGINVVQLKLSRIWDILSGHWINLSRAELPQKIEYLKNRSRNRIAKIQLVLFGWLFVALRIPMPQRIRVVYVKQFTEGATEKYVPGKYPGKITIFRAHRQPRGFIEDPYLGWEGHAEVIEIVETAGTHISIMQQHLGALVNQIRLHLNLPGRSMESGEDGKSLDHTSHMKNLSTANALPTK